MKAASVSAISVLSVALLAGCSSYKTTGQCDFSALEGYLKNPGPVLVSDISDAVAPQPLNAVSVSDKNILFKIMPRSVTAKRTETGTVRVIASLVNCTEYPQQVQARTQFYDKDNVPTESSTVWEKLFLAPNSSETYQALSVGTDAVSGYTVELRENR